MAEKNPLDTLDESNRLSLVFEQLSYLEERFKELEDVGDPPEDLQASLDGAVEELGELLANKDLCVSGLMIAPKTDEFGHVIGSVQIDDTLQSCRLVGLVVLKEGLSEEFSKGTIVLQFAIGGCEFNTLTESSSINYRATLPASMCTINIIDEMDELLSDMLPDDDDEIAAEINLALLDGTIDLHRLAICILNEFPSLTEMQREMYLNYIHKIAGLNEKEVDLLADGYVEYSSEPGDVETKEFDPPQKVEGAFRGYTISQVIDDKDQEQFLLGILVQPEEQDVILTIHVQDLAEFNISI